MHVHISFIQAIVTAFMVLLVLGPLKIAAEKYQGHPLADGFLRLY